MYHCVRFEKLLQGPRPTSYQCMSHHHHFVSAAAAATTVELTDQMDHHCHTFCIRNLSFTFLHILLKVPDFPGPQIYWCSLRTTLACLECCFKDDETLVDAKAAVKTSSLLFNFERYSC